MIKKIVIIGPESTGKSTLCRQLAAHYNTLWCPEYAREYLLAHGTDYSFEDLATIAKGQLALEDDFCREVGKTGSQADPNTPIPQNTNTGNRLLFIDTDMYVMKVWCEFVFGKCHKFILDEIVSRKYDGYLLCNIDLPWTKDELREYPDLATREKLFNIYKDLLVNQNTPWALVSGQEEERLQAAVDFLNAKTLRR